MIDTHCHLTDPRLLEQIDAVLARAAAANVKRMITVGTSVEDARRAIALCAKFPQLRCGVGIHPNYCDGASLEDVEEIRKLQTDPSVLAVGELGLDYHYIYADRVTQRKFFEAQLQLATELDKPVIIHCREAIEDSLAILRNHKPHGVVFHCFTGSPAEAEAILAEGYYISYTGVITFKKNDSLRDAVRLTPRDRLMVETDAPYLSPEPVRNQRVNEPAFVDHTAAMVAKVWDVTVGEVDSITTDNAIRFFGWR